MRPAGALSSVEVEALPRSAATEELPVPAPCYDEDEAMADPAAMAAETLLTAADLANLPDADLPHELVRGVLHRVMPAIARHGSVVSRVQGALAQHVHPRGLGELFSEATGFLLERNPDTVRCPDIAFVAGSRLPAGGLAPGFLELAPDLVVEVVSASDRTAQVVAKVADYLRLGVRCAWVFLPAERAVRVFGADGSRATIGEEGVLDGGAILPGFRLPVAFCFSALPR
jgi:Uma2 family endonuclease